MSVQSVSFSPINNMLLSCSTLEIGIWSQDPESLAKLPVTSKILCSSWTPDGQYFALGFEDGTVSIRDPTGKEKTTIQRKDSIWCLDFYQISNKMNKEAKEMAGLTTDTVIRLGCWDQTISYYDIENGNQIQEDTILDFDPCAITSDAAASTTSDGKFFFLAGSDKKLSLWSETGIRLKTVSEETDWIWTASYNSSMNQVALGTADGNLSVYSLALGMVYATFGGFFAVRTDLTTVEVQELDTGKKIQVDCGGLVEKIAIFRNNLAICLGTNEIQIHEFSFHENQDEKSTIKLLKTFTLKGNNIPSIESSSFIGLTAFFVIQVSDKKIRCFAFEGDMEREWTVDFPVTCLKVVGGRIDGEAFLIGLSNGQVLKFFVDNPFPISVLKMNGGVHSIDMNCEFIFFLFFFSFS